MTRKNLGLMGGSFDPIHNGHLGIARFIQNNLGLTGLLFIPAYVSPFKTWKEAAPAADRLAMVRLAVANEPGWEASDWEINKTGISYTYDTLLYFKEKYGAEYDLYFIIGADSALELDKWYRIADALCLCTFVVASRPGSTGKEASVRKALAEKHLTNIIWMQTPEISISSTEIREKIQKGLSIDGLVPQAIVEYIRQRDLYRR